MKHGNNDTDLPPAFRHPVFRTKPARVIRTSGPTTTKIVTTKRYRVIDPAEVAAAVGGVIVRGAK